MAAKTLSKWQKKVLIAKEVIGRLTGQIKQQVKNERISELLRGKGFVERLKMLIK